MACEIKIVKFNHTTFLATALLLLALFFAASKILGPGSGGDDPAAEPAASTRSESRTRPDLQNRGMDAADRASPPASAPPMAEKTSDEPAIPDAITESSRLHALEIMNEAAVSYDAAELPVIRPYLESPDPALRAAAVEAMIILGDSSAGPMLREAAAKLSSQEEAIQMLRAADYIELPPANLKKISEMLNARQPDEADSGAPAE